MIGLLLLMVSIVGGVMKYQESATENTESQNWKQVLQTEIKEGRAELKDMEKCT